MGTNTSDKIQTDEQKTIHSYRAATLLIKSYLKSAEGSQDMVILSISGENSIGQTKYGY